MSQKFITPNITISQVQKLRQREVKAKVIHCSSVVNQYSDSGISAAAQYVTLHVEVSLSPKPTWVEVFKVGPKNIGL